MDDFYYGAPAPFDKKPYSRATNRLGLTYFVLCLVSNVAAILLSAVYLWLHPNVTAYPDWLNWTITIVSLYLIATPLSLLCLLGIPKTPPARRRISFRTFLIFALIAFALMIGGSIIGQSVNSVVESFVGIEQGEDLTEALESSALWLTCLYSLVIAPVMEELFFRKLLIDRTCSMGTWPCVLFSGIAFGLFHGNLEQFFYATLLGFLLAYVYYNTGNLWYTVGLHSVLNFFGGILPTVVWEYTPDFFSLEGEALTEAIVSHPVAFLLNLLVALLPYLFALLGVLFLVLNARKLWRAATPTPLPREHRVSVLLGTPGAILFLAVSLLSIVLSIFS